MSEKSEADSVAQLVKASVTPNLNIKPQGLLILPNGAVKSLEDERLGERPIRKRATTGFYEAYSFIQYVNAMRQVGTIIFGSANEQGGYFHAIIDYHVPGEGQDAGWGDHQARLTLKTTPEWQRWLANDRKPMTQEQFAEFIEENLTDITQPDAASILDMAQFLQGKKTVNFKSGKRLKTGALTMEYTEQITTGGGTTTDSTDIPDGFVLGIVPFVGGAGVDLKARLRFRIGDGGKITFSYVLDRPYKHIEEAFEHTREEITGKTAITVLLGEGCVNEPRAISF